MQATTKSVLVHGCSLLTDVLALYLLATVVCKVSIFLFLLIATQ